MKKKSFLSKSTIIMCVMTIAIAMSAMDITAPVSKTTEKLTLQETVAPTPLINLTPPVVVVTTNAGGAPATQNGIWLFLSILVVAGLAFMLAIFALLRRPPN